MRSVSNSTRTDPTVNSVMLSVNISVTKTYFINKYNSYFQNSLNCNILLSYMFIW